MVSRHNSWLLQTRWSTTYPRARHLLLGLSQLPDRRRLVVGYIIGDPAAATSQDSEVQEAAVRSRAQDEQRVSCLVEAVEKMLDHCEETVERTGRPLLQWLNSSNPERTVSKPFYTPLEVTRISTVERGSGVLSFDFRGSQTSTQQRRSLTGQVIRPQLLEEVELIWNHPLWALTDTSTGRWPAAETATAVNATDIQQETQQRDVEGVTDAADIVMEGENEASGDYTREGDDEEEDEE